MGKQARRIASKFDAPTQAQKSFRTQWTAQFLVAAELARRNYVVSFTMGNATPTADLMVGHLLSGAQFWVDVKGLSSPSTWLVERPGKPMVSGLFYILVLVAQSRDKDRFFVLTQNDARKLISQYSEERGGKGSLNPLGFSGFPFSRPTKFERLWHKLPPESAGATTSLLEPPQV